ncbi:hypothetical protein [Hyphomonas sp.]|uniref:hypothetical protein n=1 Tax=Alphaproteobacteria TaxID=28211 RepID=UPI0032640895
MIPAPRRPLSPAQQYLHLRTNPICRGEGKLDGAGLLWEYRVRPTPLSRQYLVRVTMKRDGTPHVAVIQPDLVALADGRPLPHVYSKPTRLCLTLPKAREWTESMRIDQTIVPWVATWLFFFEEWLVSDDWKGGGEHPSSGDTLVRHDGPPLRH